MMEMVAVALGVCFALGLIFTVLNIEFSIEKLRKLVVPSSAVQAVNPNSNLWLVAQREHISIVRFFLNDFLRLQKSIEHVTEVAMKNSLHEKLTLSYLKSIDNRVKSFEELASLWDITQFAPKCELVAFDKVVKDVDKLKNLFDFNIYYEKNPSNEFWGDYLHTTVIIKGIFCHTLFYNTSQVKNRQLFISFSKFEGQILIEIIDKYYEAAKDASDFEEQLVFGSSYFLAKRTAPKIKGRLTQELKQKDGVTYKLQLQEFSNVKSLDRGPIR